MHQAMSYHVFNTHEYIKALMKAGMKEKQAEVIIKGFVESREYDFSKLATKEQLDVLGNSTKEQIIALEKSTKEQIIALEKSTKEQIIALEKSTKEQITVLEKSTKEQINVLRSEFKAEIATSQANILKWMIPLLFTIIAMIATIMFKMLGY